MHILIIGSGISGLNVALKATEKGHAVTIVTKKKLVESSTNLAQGGIAAVIDKTDNFKKHVKDTLTAGSFHNKKSAVEFMVRRGPKAIERLLMLGVEFASRRGELLLTKEGGHSKRRIAFVGDHTGQEIEKVLVKKAKANPNIKILENAFAVNLLVKNKTCLGAQLFINGKAENMPANAVVLATGGLGQIYKYTTNPAISTGDGYAMGFRAGCKLRDMEFIQFHPTTFCKNNGKFFLLSEALRGEGAYLRNSKGKRFMLRIHPLGELAPRDVVSKAVFEESKKGKVHLDMRHKNPHFIKTRFPKIYSELKKHEYDLTKDLIPVVPAAHYCCGGLEINPKGETCIKNLYACGEVAWTGVHGANRLASNSLLEAIVFSDQIIKSIKKKIPFADKFHFPVSRRIKLSKTLSLKISKYEKQIKNLMWDNASLIRNKQNLLDAQEEISEILEEIKTMKNIHPKVYELKNMAETSLLIVNAALKRGKSLGCHYIKPSSTRSL